MQILNDTWDVVLEFIRQPNRGYQDQILFDELPILLSLKLLVGIIEVCELVAVEVAVSDGESLLALLRDLVANHISKVLLTCCSCTFKLLWVVHIVESLSAKGNKLFRSALDDNAYRLKAAFIWVIL